MRISFILSSLALSGGVRVVIEFANRLSNRGHQVALVAPGQSTDDEIREEIDARVRICESEVVRRKDGPGDLLRLAWSLARTVPESDIIFSTHTPTTVIGLLAKLRHRSRLLWLYQDYLEMFENRPAEQWLLRNALRWHEKALVISNSCKIELESFVNKPVVVVGEGLSHVEFFQPRPWALRSRHGPKTILFLGDMRPRKGLFDFIEAANLVYQEIPNIRLQIVSKEACRVDSLAPVEFIFRPSRQELANLYASCHLFVSASWWESFGLPPLEAMACGAPVVVTNSRGVLDYAVDGHNCLVVPPRQPHALALAIKKVLSDDSLAAKLSQHGPETAKRFDWETATSRLEAELD
jgi:glycosyltransferase involved in cell wall biosynthesis